MIHIALLNAVFALSTPVLMVYREIHSACNPSLMNGYRQRQRVVIPYYECFYSVFLSLSLLMMSAINPVDDCGWVRGTFMCGGLRRTYSVLCQYTAHMYM